MISSSRKLGSSLGKMSQEQDDTKANISSNESDANAFLFSTEYLKVSGVATATKMVYASDSFIIDHPVYGDVDSSTLKIDGGYDAEISPSSCGSYYKMSDLSDSSGNGYSLTNNGAILSSSGVIGSCYSFDGSNDEMSASLDVLPSGVSECSFSLWVKDDSSGSNGPRYYQRYRGSNGIFDIGVGFDNSSTLHARVYDGSSYRYVSYSGVPPSSQLFHVVLTAKEGGSLRLYVNGSLVDTYSGFGSFGSVADQAYYLGSGNGSGYHDGLLDEVGVFSKELSSDEVSFLYSSGSPGSNQQFPFPKNGEVLFTTSF